MARGVTLAKVRDLLKVEVGEALATNTDIDTEFYWLIETIQEFLSGEYDWPFLHTQWDAACAAGSTYLDFPTSDIDGNDATLNMERAYKVDTFFDDKWRDMVYGIGTEQYNVYTLGEQVDMPVQRWVFHGATKFEVWPSPLDAQTIRFTGVRHLTSLRDESDAFDATKTLDLDHLMVVYYCAAERLARLQQGDASLKLAKARQRLTSIRGQYPSMVRHVTIGKHRLDDVVVRPTITLPGGTVAAVGNVLALEDGTYAGLDE